LPDVTLDFTGPFFQTRPTPLPKIDITLTETPLITTDGQKCYVIATTSKPLSVGSSIYESSGTAKWQPFSKLSG
jgi:hypothetical protein